MAETNGKRKAGRPTGAKATKRNKNSPPVNQWEMENGPGVPPAGTTVFGSEARNQLRTILGILHSPDSWDIFEQAVNQNQSQAVISLAAGMTPEPWTHASEKWLWDWLARVGIGKNGLSFPPFAVQVQSQAMRLHPEMQMGLESFALSVLRFGTHTLRALVEKEPQGFELAPGTFEQRPVSGEQALSGLAQMVKSAEPDKKRYALLETAQRIRLQKYNDARSKAIIRKECYCAHRLLRQKSRSRGLFLTENEVEISFRELVKEHTAKRNRKGEIINWLKEGAELEVLRRCARELTKAGTIRIDLSG